MTNVSIKDRYQKVLADVRALREELALEMKLATMEMQTKWKELEAHANQLQAKAVAAEHQGEEMTLKALDALVDKLNGFKAKVKSGSKDGRPHA